MYPPQTSNLLKQINLNLRAGQMALKGSAPDRRKCFVSYHVDDIQEVQNFIDSFGEDFLFTCLGVVDEDNFVDSTDDETIKRAIRQKHLTGTSVTIVLIGKCTSKRKFVDWEISSSLRNDSVNKRSGVVAIPLPSLNNSWTLSPRIMDNYVEGDDSASYIVGRSYPSSSSKLREYVELAIKKRDNNSNLVNNSRELMRKNLPC